MGLIKAMTNSVSSGFGDQFKEYISCPQIEKDVLIARGVVSHGSGNSNPSTGIITNGSRIAVPQGMAMMIIDNGAIKEFTAEAGEFVYDSSSEPSIFTGNLGTSIVETIKTIGSRITFGGQTARDQRVYYVNLLTITGNKFGSPQPKKISDAKYGMIEVTFFGEYAFKVADPALLINSVVGTNPKDIVTYEDVLGTQLKNKFIEQFTQAVSVVMRKYQVSFGDMGMYGTDISEEMNNVLDESWRQKYGLEITDVAIGDINITDESMKRITKIDDASIFANRDLQSGLMAQATAEAMTTAAGNEGGAMMGFYGMNMAQQSGANMMGTIYQNQQPMGQPQQTAQGQPVQPGMPEPGTIFARPEANVQPETPVTPEQPVEPQESAGPKFCTNCGTPATGNFCGNCGTKIN